MTTFENIILFSLPQIFTKTENRIAYFYWPHLKNNWGINVLSVSTYLLSTLYRGGLLGADDVKTCYGLWAKGSMNILIYCCILLQHEIKHFPVFKNT